LANQEAERVVEAFLVVKTLEKVFVYVAVGDEKTCPECAGFDGQFFSEDEAEAVFPFLEKDTNVWFPNVHPNCRCRLVMQYEKSEKYEMVPPKASHSIVFHASFLLLSPRETGAVGGGQGIKMERR